ncbi:MAG: HNH endonuclease signature motif containing protein [Planctomycetaceae bacterium]
MEKVAAISLFAQVYANQSCWDHIWRVPPDVLGTVGYDCGDGSASDMAREIAQLMELKRRLAAIRASVQTGVVTATVLIQTGNDPLDVIVSAHEAITNPSWRNPAAMFLAALPVFSAALVGKTADAADVGKAEDMATRETGAVDPGHIPLSQSISRIHGKQIPYPQLRDPRTGGNIHFPTGIQGPVDKSRRVSWDSKKDSAAFLAEWHRWGYATPLGGWDKCDIRHIQPQESGGTNDFWNLVPVERSTHQDLFLEFWREFTGL